MQTAAFFTKWLKDLAAEQKPDGLVNNMVPTPLSIEEMFSTAPSLEGSAGWGDAAVIVPWTLYQVFGDRRILQEQYASMKAWIEYERRNAQNYLWDSSYHFGEWLEPDALESTLSMLAEVFAGKITPKIHDYMTHPHVATSY